MNKKTQEVVKRRYLAPGEPPLTGGFLVFRGKYTGTRAREGLTRSGENMNKYQVTHYMMDDDGHHTSIVSEVVANHYDTQATQGARLVADFYHGINDTRPVETYSQVISVRKVSEGIFLTKEESAKLYRYLSHSKLYEEAALRPYSEGMGELRVKLWDGTDKDGVPYPGKGACNRD